MLERDGKTEDQVVTSVKHRELWRRTDDGWRVARIAETWHGPVLVNGRVHEP